MTTPPTKLRIDIVSDVVCPWCIIGYRQLAKALEATGRAHEIHWHPFELNPAMSSEGQNLRDHVAAEVGLERDEALDVLEDQRFATDVRTAENYWLSQGIRGVPAMIFNRRHLVSAAQGVESYTRILERLSEIEQGTGVAPDQNTKEGDQDHV